MNSSLRVENTGKTPMRVDGHTILPGSFRAFRWNGKTWRLCRLSRNTGKRLPLARTQKVKPS